MLKSWSLQNFKPILALDELKLAPVTVLAGRNSSGKSSLIQSILMIAQTLSSRVLDRALLPNGPIVQLGTFEDILSEQANVRTLAVGFELEIVRNALFSFDEYFEPLALDEDDEPPVFDEDDEPPVFDEDDNDRWTSRAIIKNTMSVKVATHFRSAVDHNTSTSAIEASKVTIENVLLEILTHPSDGKPI